MSQLEVIKKELGQVSSPERARNSQRYFKTGPGEYGEGDEFIGATMPQQREIAKKYLGIDLKSIQNLLNSRIHEERMVGLLILTYKFPNADESEKNEIFDFYLRNTQRINNWDLVDVTAPKIVGEYLLDKDRKVLTKLAGSELLWDRRIAIIATATFINNGEYEWTFRLTEMLIEDSEDLIHKATGWMLREVGKKCGEDIEVEFLDRYASKMPRTMLRYAIERFSPQLRRAYLQGNR